MNLNISIENKLIDFVVSNNNNKIVALAKNLDL